MNFEFSDDVTVIREEVRRLLTERVPPGAVRRLVDAGQPFDRPLWQEIGALGWMGISLPEAFGGSGLDHETLCMLAEEIGRVAASVPFSSSIYLAAEAIALFGSEEQKRTWLPGLASGEVVGTFALAEGNGFSTAEHVRAAVLNGRITGRKLPVWDGLVADLFVVAARDADGDIGLYLVTAQSVIRTPLETIEYGREAAAVVFENGIADRLLAAKGWSAVEKLLDRAAILFAFEAVGGAEAILTMAVDYTTQRFAFGRSIASMQAIKHMLADVYVAIELARSNAYYGAWALAHDAPELTIAAATARLAAIAAYETASAQAIQVHGGMGFTQEVDCHIHYRRAKRLATEIGPRRYWSDRLIAHLPATAG